MTGKEIAELLNISYDTTYRRNPKFYQKRLEGYCDFTSVRGGVIIETIYMADYKGDLSSKLSKDICDVILENKEELGSAAGIARALQKKRIFRFYIIYISIQNKKDFNKYVWKN